MISKDLLEILVCPESHQTLSLAEGPLVAKVNAAIAKGTLRNKAGSRVEKAIEAGLIREDGAVLYPVLDDIPIMLVDEAISLDQLAG